MPAKQPETTTELFYTIHKSAVGRLHLVTSATHLQILAFDTNWPKLLSRLEQRIEKSGKTLRLIKSENKIATKTISQLGEFLGDRRREFSIPCDPQGTPFERQAWSELMKLGYGSTATYSNQAKKLKRPLAVRAVGAANGRNPISILIPCHRVIGQSGQLTGYAGGLDVKRRLLELEGMTF